MSRPRSIVPPGLGYIAEVAAERGHALGALGRVGWKHKLGESLEEPGASPSCARTKGRAGSGPTLPHPRPTTTPQPSGLNQRSPFFSREPRRHSRPQSALPLRPDRRALRLPLLGPRKLRALIIFLPLCVFAFCR